MKLSFSLFVASLFSGFASAVNSKSATGKKLLSKARRLDEDDGEIDFSWVGSYDIKYQGCHHIKQWNEEADGQDDVRIYTKRLVRFRLCPSDSCSASQAGGCKSGFGDYIIDMDTFVEAYMEAKREDTENDCETFMQYNCDCEDDDGKGDDFDREYCEYDCYMDAGKEDCVDRNPYEDDEQEQMEEERFAECAQLDVENDDDGYEYFAGPYCSEQGGAIKIGVFTDDSCTEFASASFYDLMGYDIKYTYQSMVGEECVSCLEPQDVNEQQNNNNNNGNDAEDEDMVREQCEMLYQLAGKCETYLPSDMVDANTGACSYMEGIKIVRADGLIDVSSARPSAIATAFIVIFAMAFAAMAFYVWYLRTRLGVKKNALL